MDLSLLCVHAHPDDESIWTGGTLARYADEGARTAVVTCTWAEGTNRAGELERALDLLGAGKPRLLGYADAGKPESAPGRPRFVDVPLDEAVGLLVEHIRSVRPDVVLTFDGYGSSGHADHVHVHRVTMAAVEAAGYDQLYPEAGDPWRPRALYLSTLPRSVVESQWESVFGAPPAPGQTLPGVPDDQITTHLDVSPWAERKWAAMHAHESEVGRGASMTMLTALPEQARAQLLSNEWYRRVAYTGPQERTLS
ncbi:N-acetyl-1-D-myo-inositol-2-amino-2-deoxy-alpha-D-glucopyranoside deacetylase [Nonomuraea solani]|uniref:N-acetyl-1-D-myo-inositol-2-amino-2-deoxy-alpha-D-glucopyranoside deacetylase n=1 Tax=Nonomuraea solani TaxID=1144553 RepID=A0A1H6E268_9ACTN|nr:PIG-L family deacetylase [Nonomuraea solani]SEG91657.1 N-acetyl-1-D-myo-inositol-2-amino-2-deoxy-alpha-D-glucopyranoside deacetylase [Nonomuraea solani]